MCWCCWCCCCCWCCWCCCCETCRIRCMVASLLFLCCLSSSLSPFFSLSLSSHQVSPTQFPSRTCSAACLAARQVLRRPLALRMCGPLSTRIHHALCHHVMCLFDTWHSSGSEFTSSSCSPWAFTTPSCPPGLSLRFRAPPGPQPLSLAQLVFPEHSLLSRSS